MPERVVVLLEVIDVADEDREAFAMFAEAGDFIVETLHERAMVRQASEAIGRGKQLQLFVLFAQSLVDAIELGAPIAQAIDHVIEDVGQITDLTTTRRCRQVDSEVARRDFTRGFGETIERT